MDQFGRPLILKQIFYFYVLERKGAKRAKKKN